MVGFSLTSCDVVKDPADLAALPAIDIRGAVGGLTPGGGAFVRIVTDDVFEAVAWSWYLEADLVDGQGSSVSTIYYQRGRAGERATYVDGVPNGGGVEVVEEPNGILMHIPPTKAAGVRVSAGYANEGAPQPTADAVEGTIVFDEVLLP